MSRPNVFSSVGALSPCCLAVNDDFNFGNDAWKRASKGATMEDLQQLFDDSDYYPVATIGVITAFSSRPGSPPIHANFPYEIIRGEVVLDNDAYDRHLDSFPVRKIRKSRSALRNLRGLGLSVGLGDQFLHIPIGTMEFSQMLGWRIRTEVFLDEIVQTSKSPLSPKPWPPSSSVQFPRRSFQQVCVHHQRHHGQGR